MKSYTRDSKYSEIFQSVLKTGKGFNVAMNNSHIIKELIKNDAETLSMWLNFEKVLKDSKLRLILFAVAFDKTSDQYHIAYEIQSKIHKNQPIRIDRKFDFPIPFCFVPSAFPEWLRDTLEDMPVELIAEVASGG